MIIDFFAATFSSFMVERRLVTWRNHQALTSAVSFDYTYFRPLNDKKSCHFTLMGILLSIMMNNMVKFESVYSRSIGHILHLKKGAKNLSCSRIEY